MSSRMEELRWKLTIRGRSEIHQACRRIRSSSRRQVVLHLVAAGLLLEEDCSRRGIFPLRVLFRLPLQLPALPRLLQSRLVWYPTPCPGTTSRRL